MRLLRTLLSICAIQNEQKSMWFFPLEYNCICESTIIDKSDKSSLSTTQRVIFWSLSRDWYYKVKAPWNFVICVLQSTYWPFHSSVILCFKGAFVKIKIADFTYGSTTYIVCWYNYLLGEMLVEFNRLVWMAIRCTKRLRFDVLGKTC